MSLSTASGSHDVRRLVSLYQNARKDGAIDRAVVASEVPKEAVDATVSLLETQQALLEKLSTMDSAALRGQMPPEAEALSTALSALGWNVETETAHSSVLKTIRHSTWAPWVVAGASVASMVSTRTEIVAPRSVSPSEFDVLSPGPLGPLQALAVPKALERSPLFAQGMALPPESRRAVVDTLLNTRGAENLNVIVADTLVDSVDVFKTLSDTLGGRKQNALVVDVEANEARWVGDTVLSQEQHDAVYAALETLETELDTSLRLVSQSKPSIESIDVSQFLKTLPKEQQAIADALTSSARGLRITAMSDDAVYVGIEGTSATLPIMVKEDGPLSMGQDEIVLSSAQHENLEKLLRNKRGASGYKALNSKWDAVELEVQKKRYENSLASFEGVAPEKQPVWVWMQGVGFQGDPQSKVPAYLDGRFNPEVQRFSDEVYRTGEFPEEKEKSELREHLEDWRGLRGKSKGYDPQQYFEPGRDHVLVDRTLAARDSLLPEDVEQNLVNCFWMAAFHASLSQDPTFVDEAVREVSPAELQRKYPNLAPELRNTQWFEVTVFPKNILGPRAQKVWVSNLTNEHMEATGTAPKSSWYSRTPSPVSMQQLKAIMFEKAFYVFQGSIEEHEWGNSKNALTNMHGTAGGYIFTDLAGKMQVYRKIRAMLRRGEALVAVAYDVRGNLEGSLGKMDFLLKLVRERNPGQYGVTDQHCYSIVDAREEKKPDGTSEYVVYVRNPRLNYSKTDMHMPTPRGPDWDEYLTQQKRLTLEEFYEAFTFIAHADVPGAKGYPRE